MPTPLSPLTVHGRDHSRSVTFRTPVLLAPMEGVTDRCFRSAVLDLGGVGGACTEFIRVSVAPVTSKVIARQMDEPREGVPVGVQIMAPGPEHVAQTVRRAVDLGAPWIDLNFGCPVKRVFGKGAGSSLLDHPKRLGEIVRAAAEATDVPVTAKIRAGVTDDSRLTDVLDAAAENGAGMITIHARRRVDSYATKARWEWIATAATWLRARHPSVALIGNGGIEVARDVRRMIDETGCHGVMIGRAAIRNPFIFREAAGAPSATAVMAAQFAVRYLELVQPDPASNRSLGRCKQLVRCYTAGGLFDGREDVRRTLLRAPSGETLRAFFAAVVTAPG